MIGQRLAVVGIIGLLAGTAAETAAAQPAPTGAPATGTQATRALTGTAAKPGATKGKAAKAKGVKSSGAKPDKPAEPPAAWMSVDPDRVARPDGAAPPPPGHKAVVSHTPSGDPVEIGGKWNGSNESSAQTRAQNYNGDAEGTGGSVGLKLHF